MKKKLLIATLILVSFLGQSQILITLLFGDKLNSDGLEFGLEGGINLSSISGLETNNYINTFNLGFYFDIRLKNSWSLYTGVLVKSNLGVDKLTEKDIVALYATLYKDVNEAKLNGTYSQKMNYFLVPIFIKYKFKNHIYIETGPQFGLMYKSWIEFNADIDGKDGIFKDYNKDNINKIDAGAVLGIGYKLLKGTGWTIGLKYYYGFIDVYKNISNTKNNSLFIKLNIPIGAGKKDAIKHKK
jgi:hypothetical protein